MFRGLGIPLLMLMVLLFVYREEFGFKGILLCVAICIGMLVACALFACPYVFAALLALFDIILIMAMTGGDVRIW